MLGVVLNDSVFSPVPEGLPLLTSPPATARPPHLSVQSGLDAPFSHFFVFFGIQKNVEKTDRQKYTFFAIFGGFGSPRRRFLAIFGPKTGSRKLLFRCFLENGDFVKIVLLLVVGTRFCRVGPSKNRS